MSTGLILSVGLIFATRATIAPHAVRMLSVQVLETKAKATIRWQAAWSVGLSLILGVGLILSVEALETKAKATIIGQAARSVGLIL